MRSASSQLPDVHGIQVSIDGEYIHMSKMEPILVTEPRLIPVLEELKKREPIFHRAENGTSPADFENMTDPDFWVVGESGRRYTRESDIDSLVARHTTPNV